MKDPNSFSPASHSSVTSPSAGDLDRDEDPLTSALSREGPVAPAAHSGQPGGDCALTQKPPVTCSL